MKSYFDRPRLAVHLPLMAAAAFMLVIWVPLPTLAATINVPAESPTIQSAVLAASDGDTVLVQPGEYLGFDLRGKNLVVGSLFLLTGDQSQISATIINQTQPGQEALVNITDGEDSTAQIVGFTIADGRRGIRCVNASPTITCNVIVNQGQFQIVSRGAGVYLEESDAILDNNIIANNRASGSLEGGVGGGIYMVYSDPILRNNTIVRNRVFAYWDYTESFGGIGGGIYAVGSNPMMVNCILRNNEAEVEANELHGINEVNYCNVEDGYTGTGNIDTNPLFVDAGAGDYNVCIESPCVDAGAPELLDPDSTVSDMGVYYSWHPVCITGTSWYVSTDGDDLFGDGSLLSPFATLQYAVNLASHGDSVILRPGSYTQDVLIDDKQVFLGSEYLLRSRDDLVDSTILIGGGITALYCDRGTVVAGLTIHSASAGVRFQRSGGTLRDAKLLNCETAVQLDAARGSRIVSCDLIGSTSHGVSGSASYATVDSCRIAETQTNSAILVEGGNWQISACQIIDNDDGGIHSYKHDTVTIVGNTITGNTSSGLNGGGIVLFGGYCLVSENIITGNAGCFERAGGISCRYNVYIDISDNIISENSGYAKGGGIFLSQVQAAVIDNNYICDNYLQHPVNAIGGGLWVTGGDFQISNNVFCRNSALRGGAVAMGGSEAVFTNNTFVENSAELEAGAIFVHNNSHPTLDRCIVAFNSSPTEAVHVWDATSDVSLACTDIFGNSSGDWVGTIADQLGVEGNFSADPLFCDTSSNDYHIVGISPCAVDYSTCNELVGAKDIGCAVEPHTLMLPSTLFAFQAQSLDPEAVSVLFGDFVNGYDASMIDFETVVLRDSIPALTTDVLADHPAFYTDPVSAASFSTAEFLQSYPPFWETAEYEYTVSGLFTDGEPFEITGSVTISGHRAGDLDVDGRIDIADLVFMVDYFFLNGSPPVLVELADVDGSCGQADIADLIYLVAYFFESGPPPVFCSQ